MKFVIKTLKDKILYCNKEIIDTKRALNWSVEESLKVEWREELNKLNIQIIELNRAIKTLTIKS